MCCKHCHSFRDCDISRLRLLLKAEYSPLNLSTKAEAGYSLGTRLMDGGVAVLGWAESIGPRPCP